MSGFEQQTKLRAKDRLYTHLLIGICRIDFGKSTSHCSSSVEETGSIAHAQLRRKPLKIFKFFSDYLIEYSLVSIWLYDFLANKIDWLKQDFTNIDEKLHISMWFEGTNYRIKIVLTIFRQLIALKSFEYFWAWHGIDMPLTCHWHAIDMPFTCHSHAIHMPFTCHSHAIDLPLTYHWHGAWRTTQDWGASYNHDQLFQWKWPTFSFLRGAVSFYWG